MKRIQIVYTDVKQKIKLYDIHQEIKEKKRGRIIGVIVAMRKAIIALIRKF